jgi:hypothetical protein
MPSTPVFHIYKMMSNPSLKAKVGCCFASLLALLLLLGPQSLMCQALLSQIQPLLLEALKLRRDLLSLKRDAMCLFWPRPEIRDGELAI